MTSQAIDKPVSFTDALIASDMIEAETAICDRINSPEFPQIKLNPSAIYCSKTGQPIGYRNQETAFAAIKICGKTQFIENAFFAYGTNIHPAWIATSGPALDELLDRDPVGYASYTFGIICSKYSKKPMRYDRASIAAEHWALARAYALLSGSGLSEQDLLELNFKCCELLTYGEHAISLIIQKFGKAARQPDYMASLAARGLLQSEMDSAISKASNSYRDFDYAKHRQQFEDRPMSPADAARGPSNIRGQRRSKNRVKVSQMAAMFANFGFGQVMTQAERDRASGHTRGTVFDNIQTQSKPLTTDLNQLAMLDFSKVQAVEDDTDDYSVEVRTITEAEADFLLQKQEEAFKMPEGIKQTPPTTGLSPVLASLIAKPAKPEAEPAKIENPKLNAFFAALKGGKK